MYKAITYADYEEYYIFDITNDGVQTNCILKKQNVRNGSNIESIYYYNETTTTESEYTSVKDKYIKETARGENFQVLSSENLNNSFSN